jgi:uncharacterized protein (UPF0335 family)
MYKSEIQLGCELCYSRSLYFKSELNKYLSKIKRLESELAEYKKAVNE